MARKLRRPMSPAKAIGRALTRRARPVSADGADARQNARALSATLGREGAAARLGVSERTLRRWRAGATPSRANAERLAAAATAAPEVRRQDLSPRREARLRNRGAYVRLSGLVGGGTPGARRKNTRQRTVGEQGLESVHLSGDDMSGILDRWEAGDDQGALDALRDAMRQTPWGSEFGNFEFEDLTMLEFLRDDPNG
jgi:DNA-binding transcriptional regulator YdaS (Cro superfamily)